MKTNSVTATNNSLNSNSTKSLNSTEIAIKNSAKFMGYLRKDIYTHHLRTAVQEILSNARDAHREVGQKRAYQVFAPTADDLNFTVKDFGPGISPDRMQNIYVNMGESTKDKTNNQIGGFGVGSKLPLAYTDSFMVISVVNKLKYRYLITTAKTQAGEAIDLDNGNPQVCNEDNYTQIQFSVKPQDIVKCQDAIRRYCFFCPVEERPEIFNMEPMTFVENLKQSKIGVPGSEMGSVYLIEESLPGFLNHSGQVVILVEGIPHAATEFYSKNLVDLQNSIKHKIIFNFKVGVLEPHISRERLPVSDKNIEVIDSMAGLVLSKSKQEIEAKISGASNAFEFYLIFKDLNNKYQINSMKYKNIYFSNDGKISGDVFKHVSMEKRQGVSSYIKKWKKGVELTINEIEQGKVIYFEPINTRSEELVLTKKINQYVRKNGAVTILSSAKDDPASIADFETIVNTFSLKKANSFELIKPEKVNRPKVSHSEKRAKTKINFLHKIVDKSQSNSKKIEEFEQNTNTLYIYISKDIYTANKNKKASTRMKDLDSYMKKIKEYYENDQLIFIGLKDRDFKKVKDIKNFIHFDEWVKRIEVTHEDRVRYLYTNKANESVLKKIQKFGYQFKNNFLNQMIKSYKYINEENEKSSKKWKTMPEVVTELCKNDPEVKDFLKKDEKLSILIEEKMFVLKDISEYASEKTKVDIANYLDEKLKKDGV